MKEIIIEVPDDFGKALKPYKVNSEIKGELVRCKDCRWNTGTKDKPYCVAVSREPDWFCADGKRS